MRAFIFDFDGVVADTQTHWDILGGDHVRKIAPSLRREDDVKLKGRSARDNYEMLVTEHGATFTEDAWHTHLRDFGLTIYREHAAPTVGLHELLLRLQAFPNLATPSIASASVKEWIEEFLARFDLRTSFGFITTGDEVARSKPQPDVYLKAAEKLGIPPLECIAVEDSDAGLTAAKAAGMFCIGFHSSAHMDQALAAADLHIGTFDQLTPEVLASLIA